MKLRTYLLLANSISIAFIIVFLLVSFQYMLVTKEQLIWLGAATIGAGIVSAGLHFLLVRPLESSVRRMRDGAVRIASGDLKARVDQRSGLAEFRELAVQFNAMGASLDHGFGQVKAAERAQRELVANIAHDLRTPLASLQSYAEALEDGIAGDEETFRRYVSTIRTESIRLGELIQDVFDLSTLDADRASCDEHRDSESVFEDLLVELLPRFAPQLNAKSVRLRVQAPERSLTLRMSALHLARVLQNLIENAVRYSPQGGIIVVEAKELPDRRVWIGVADEGAGISSEDRERIFERFYRADKSRSRENGGSGLGLSIAKLLVEQYGGEIGVESAPGHGSRFWFTVREA